jgi:hypothetical protein
MRKLLIGLLVGVALVLTACGGSSLTSVQSKAVKDVNTQLAQYGVNVKSETVVGRIDKDGQGNTVVLVQETYQLKDSNGKTQTYDVIVIVVTAPNGKLIFADVLLPSGIVTVTP